MGRVRVEEIEEAATPGTVTHKLPVYDENGEVLGYVAIYDDIAA